MNTPLKIIIDSSKEILIVMDTGTQHNFLWKKEYYVKLCRLINQYYKAKIIFIGIKNFESYVQEIQNHLNFKAYSLVGKTTLNELASVLEKIDLLITVDNGVCYIESSVGLRTIVLRHRADSSIEFGKHVETEIIVLHSVPCSPCGNNICPLDLIECMVGITPQRVFSEIKYYLSNSFNGFKIV